MNSKYLEGHATCLPVNLNPFTSGIALQTVHSDAVTGKFNNVLHWPDRLPFPPKTKQKRQKNEWGCIIFIVGAFFCLCAIEIKVSIN